MTGRPEIDTGNDQLVSMTMERVTVLFPANSMSPAAAVRHAAWLVAIAEIIEPGAEEHFSAVLKAVQNT